ncbi:hypothetical protein ESY86_06590 [Subsaximicrobium wynnwilliamsii]|uniref:Uncharacterized protein n=1 Tax=Subsaximicrobium wynnwilliamsii TaxID=291179 RepID=A0A5C6ZI49_9FLAO|nr:hypothetical protein [Subsaximicrobium wynnwilliamsii]TXD84244.1 hypothetical protein ESY87_07005 [Subsaximicrobium wynnwilliamsii]TXD89865.1 hypothetical protein ESY86_06590 [Subsaximicrobium wynnwilliamsii]TXE03956.1 hypothetical protein ESY88_07000 [Subsaximicrobium wynnwilliamsii]
MYNAKDTIFISLYIFRKWNPAGLFRFDERWNGINGSVKLFKFFLAIGNSMRFQIGKIRNFTSILNKAINYFSGLSIKNEINLL